MRRDVDLADKLKQVRRFTGDKFSAANGYDLRKGLSRARVRTIEKYYELLAELTSRPHMVITPPKGAKREAFEFTGQKRHPRFAKAIVHTPDPAARYDFVIDRSRPKGSRFVQVNRRTGERMWHIPAEIFLAEDPELFDDGRDLDPEFFTGIIEEYGERAEVYVIQAGSYHMWGAAGTPQSVGERLARLFKDYGAGNFNDFDPGSSWIGNWFRGVEAFADASDFMPYFEAKVRARAEVLRRVPRQQPFEKYRLLKSGDIGVFDRGRLVAVAPVPTKPTGQKRKRTRRRRR